MRNLFLILISFLAYSASVLCEVFQIAGGLEHTCALLRNGALYCWGGNDEGQLGLGDSDYRTRPTKLILPKTKKAIGLSASTLNTCVLYSDGTLSCWGLNFCGQLGLGLLRNIGALPSDTPDKLLPIPLGKDRKVKQFDMGPNNTCALLDNDSVKCWGCNGNGELGQGDTLDRGRRSDDMGDYLPQILLGNAKPVQVEVGGDFACVLFSNRTLKCWGRKEHNGSGTNSIIGSHKSHMGDNLKYVNLGKNKEIISLSAGHIHTCVLLSDETIKCWGENYYGNLGVGVSEGVVIGDSQDEMGDNLKVTELGNLPATDLSCRVNSCCARFVNNALKCWGFGGVGTLGLGDSHNRGTSLSGMGENLPFIDLGRLFKIDKIGSADYHICGISAGGEAKCWGLNSKWQLANGSTGNIGSAPNQMGDNLSFLVIPAE